MYASALIFSPARSITRNLFENEEAKWIVRKPAMADNWSACLQTFEGHRGSVNLVAWSHDATRLASALYDEIVKIWDSATGQCISTLEGHRSSVNLVAWSHDTTRLASALYDGTVKIWDPATGQCISTLEGHRGSVNSVAWSHDATRLASASYEKTVKIWDPATGQCISTLEGHRNIVNLVAWSHDATRLASASDDKTVKIWDPATGQCISTLEGHRMTGGTVNDLQFHESNSNLLRTNLGTFDLGALTISTVFGPAFTGRSSPIAVGYGLSSNGTWITYQGVNLLWLSPEYRPSSSAISGTAVSIGCSSGRVLIFTFTDSSPIQ